MSRWCFSVAAGCLAAIAMAAPSGATAFTAHANFATWEAGLRGTPLVTPWVRPVQAVLGDSFGEWTEATRMAPVTVLLNGQPTPMTRDLDQGGRGGPEVFGADWDFARLGGLLGCWDPAATINGCLGANRVTFRFDIEVAGVFGHLRIRPNDVATSLFQVFDLFRVPNFGVVFLPPIPPFFPGGPGFGFDGLYGVVFDRPMREFSVALTRDNIAGQASFAWTGLSYAVSAAATVPAPGALGLFGAGLLGLVALQRRGANSPGKPRSTTAR